MAVAALHPYANAAVLAIAVIRLLPFCNGTSEGVKLPEAAQTARARGTAGGHSREHAGPAALSGG